MIRHYGDDFKWLGYSTDPGHLMPLNAQEKKQRSSSYSAAGCIGAFSTALVEATGAGSELRTVARKALEDTDCALLLAARQYSPSWRIAGSVLWSAAVLSCGPN